MVYSADILSFCIAFVNGKRIFSSHLLPLTSYFLLKLYPLSPAARKPPKVGGAAPSLRSARRGQGVRRGGRRRRGDIGRRRDIGRSGRRRDFVKIRSCYALRTYRRAQPNAAPSLRSARRGQGVKRGVRRRRGDIGKRGDNGRPGRRRDSVKYTFLLCFANVPADGNERRGFFNYISARRRVGGASRVKFAAVAANDVMPLA